MMQLAEIIQKLQRLEMATCISIPSNNNSTLGKTFDASGVNREFFEVIPSAHVVISKNVVGLHRLSSIYFAKYVYGMKYKGICPGVTFLIQQTTKSAGNVTIDVQIDIPLGTVFVNDSSAVESSRDLSRDPSRVIRSVTVEKRDVHRLFMLNGLTFDVNAAEPSIATCEIYRLFDKSTPEMKKENTEIELLMIPIHTYVMDQWGLYEHVGTYYEPPPESEKGDKRKMN